MIKTIEGFNGRYTIDDNGNIYSKGKLMHPYKINSGYLAIKLRNKGKVTHCLVHRLVAEYFLGKEEDKVVDHIDGNRLNNNVKNLRYCTQKENVYYHGYEYNTGVNNYNSRFTVEDIKTIRSYREKMGMRNRDIYKLYPQVTPSCIDQILNYKTYKKIPC